MFFDFSTLASVCGLVVVVIVTGTFVRGFVVLVCLFIVQFVLVSGGISTRSVSDFFTYVLVLYR